MLQFERDVKSEGNSCQLLNIVMKVSPNIAPEYLIFYVIITIPIYFV